MGALAGGDESRCCELVTISDGWDMCMYMIHGAGRVVRMWIITLSYIILVLQVAVLYRIFVFPCCSVQLFSNRGAR